MLLISALLIPRLCVVLVVPGIGAYNDSITSAFRAFAREGTTVHHRTVSFAYIDAERQAEFLKAVSSRSVDLKQCSSGELARSVSRSTIYIIGICKWSTVKHLHMGHTLLSLVERLHGLISEYT